MCLGFGGIPGGGLYLSIPLLRLLCFFFSLWRLETCLFLFRVFTAQEVSFCPVVRFLEEEARLIALLSLESGGAGGWVVGRETERERTICSFFRSIFGVR